MTHEKLDPELERRIKLVEDPTYEGESLNKTNYTAFIVVVLATMSSSVKYGIDIITSSKPQFGTRGVLFYNFFQVTDSNSEKRRQA